MSEPNIKLAELWFCYCGRLLMLLMANKLGEQILPVLLESFLTMVKLLNKFAISFVLAS
jgi:hypothetical protein